MRTLSIQIHWWAFEHYWWSRLPLLGYYIFASVRCHSAKNRWTVCHCHHPVTREEIGFQAAMGLVLFMITNDATFLSKIWTGHDNNFPSILDFVLGEKWYYLITQLHFRQHRALSHLALIILPLLHKIYISTEDLDDGIIWIVHIQIRENEYLRMFSIQYIFKQVGEITTKVFNGTVVSTPPSKTNGRGFDLCGHQFELTWFRKSEI